MTETFWPSLYSGYGYVITFFVLFDIICLAFTKPTISGFGEERYVDRDWHEVDSILASEKIMMSVQTCYHEFWPDLTFFRPVEVRVN